MSSFCLFFFFLRLRDSRILNFEKIKLSRSHFMSFKAMIEEIELTYTNIITFSV